MTAANIFNYKWNIAMPQFTTNFPRPYMDTWKRLFPSIKWNPDKPKTIVEIGSQEGFSALWFANNLLCHPESTLYCLDLWPQPAREQLFLSNIGEYQGPARIVPVKGRSQDTLIQLIERGVTADLVYVDGEHSAPGVLVDLVLSFRLLKVGGLCLCDDYLWDDPRYGGADIIGRPKLAIDAFTSIYAQKIRLIAGVPIMQIAFTKISD